MSCPNGFLFLFRKISRETCDAFRAHPDAPVRNFDITENIGGGELFLLALRSFVGIGGECGYVNEPCNTVIGSGGGNDASTVGMANEDGRTADPAQRPFYRVHVAFESVEAVLGGHHLVTLRLKCRDDLIK